MTNYRGIDYGLGRTNKDSATGIRFGVIPQNDVLQAWADSSEPYYGKPVENLECPDCGEEIAHPEKWGDTVQCDCGKNVECELPDFAEPLSFSYDEDGYHAECGQDGDIFITESPYFTYAQFCSPCAPGACYLRNPLDVPFDAQERPLGGFEDNRAYCFGHDWFEDGRAPYPVYSVATGELVNPQ